MSIRIILVDDHEMVRRGLITVLQEQEDLEIVGEAGDGLTAIRLAEELKPDLMVLDVEMPGLDGIETARQILRISPNSKILALSIHKEQDYVTAMFSVGASGYILKESALDELVEAIRTVDAGQKYISSKLVDIVLTSLGGTMPSAYESKLSQLTPREIEVLKLIAEGNITKEIAHLLHVSPKTVDAHRQQIMKKLDIHTIADLTRLAIREGLIAL